MNRKLSNRTIHAHQRANTQTHTSPLCPHSCSLSRARARSLALYYYVIVPAVQMEVDKDRAMMEPNKRVRQSQVEVKRCRRGRESLSRQRRRRGCADGEETTMGVAPGRIIIAEATSSANDRQRHTRGKEDVSTMLSNTRAGGRTAEVCAAATSPA